MPGLPLGEQGILESYQRAIENAQQFIFIENQYFTNPVIFSTLKLALDANANLQLILLLNEKPDVPGFGSAQITIINHLLSNHPNQVGVFTLWKSQEFANTMISIRQCYIHSKTAIVDDKWATIGTANLDGVSLTHIYYGEIPLYLQVVADWICNSVWRNRHFSQSSQFRNQRCLI